MKKKYRDLTYEDIGHKFTWQKGDYRLEGVLICVTFRYPVDYIGHGFQFNYHNPCVEAQLAVFTHIVTLSSSEETDRTVKIGLDTTIELSDDKAAAVKKRVTLPRVKGVAPNSGVVPLP